MKPYVDPASRPIRCPPVDVDDSFLLEPTWEPLEIILDPSLILKYYQDHPSAKNIVHHAISSAEQTSPDIPVIAAFSLCYRPIPAVTTHSQVEPISPPVKSVEPIFRHYRPFSSVYLLSFALLLLVDIHPSTVHPVPVLNNTFSPQQKRFYDQLLWPSSHLRIFGSWLKFGARFVNDLLMTCCCGLCALIQNAQEVGVKAPFGNSMARS